MQKPQARLLLFEWGHALSKRPLAWFLDGPNQETHSRTAPRVFSFPAGDLSLEPGMRASFFLSLRSSKAPQAGGTRQSIEHVLYFKTNPLLTS